MTRKREGARRDDERMRGQRDEDDETKKGRHIKRQRNNELAQREDERAVQQEDVES